MQDAGCRVGLGPPSEPLKCSWRCPKFDDPDVCDRGLAPDATRPRLTLMVDPNPKPGAVNGRERLPVPSRSTTICSWVWVASRMAPQAHPTDPAIVQG